MGCLPGLLGRDRAQPDPERRSQLGAQGQATDLDPPVQLEEGLHGSRAVLWGARRRGQLALHIHPGNYDTDPLIAVLGELRKFLGGETATLLWDGLPAPRSRAMRAWLRSQRPWLVVEGLPAYAPERNPVEAYGRG
jgi:DDE superfamily endonuclease